ncbi:hypothetical protein BGZ99_003995 [Dissophora globulifera]|uniref:sn-1-specific diacylglycerol lipase n=1 Tax=Dissophora globulifera TaxID=979702 RepID=A0A9P6V098_9FUNG|nr:hypothetical protein BGZ99_003995 [Dissophora globulifera]
MPPCDIIVVPEYLTLRLRSLECKGLHGKTQVKLKLQNHSQRTKPAKNLDDHTHQSFDFQTTIHNMTFDIVKIDVYEIKTFNQHHKIGRAYLSLRDLQKMVGNKYDNDGDNNTEPEQSVLSSRFDATTFCKKHDDVFEVSLPLHKHGSYSKFGSNDFQQQLMHDDDDDSQDGSATTGSQYEKDMSLPLQSRPVHADSFAQLAMNGIQVGTLTIQATLHFKDQTQNPLFAHLGRGAGSISRNTSRRRSLSDPSADSTLLSGSATLNGNHQNGISNNNSISHISDQILTSSSSTEIMNSSSNGGGESISAPIAIPHSSLPGDSGRILKLPSSPPNLSRHFGSPGSPGSPGSLSSTPLSPGTPQSPDSPASPDRSFQWLAKNSIPHGALLSQDESELSHDESSLDRDGGEIDEDISSSTTRGLTEDGSIKGEHLSETDRKREEDLMAGIMANGDPAKRDMYLNRSGESGESSTSPRHPKGKKAKFSLFSEQTRSAFKDIQLMYSSFFGHGWNLTRAEFWKGFHIVEEYYACHPTPTTNNAFDDIEILEKARHFVRLAIASYGSLPWVYFGYSFKVAPLNFVRFHSDRKNVVDYFKLKKEDMIVWHFDKRTALVPSYYIVRDPKFNALCIIIRGTFSITDAMTDLVCEYYPYKGGLVHKGIMDNARFVLEHSGKDIEAALKKFNLKTIYCIGHSLGAGSSSLLCSLLQDHFADYIVPATSTTKAQRLEVKAYLFAPPPICTPNLALKWERTQIAFINENDLVCRLSYGNALDLKELIKIAALESENPVYKGLGHKEKLDRIIKVLEKAQESLLAVDDVPRLVTAGTVAYLHKVYEDTPVFKNKDRQRTSNFGLPEGKVDETHSSKSTLSLRAHGGVGQKHQTSLASTSSHVSQLSRSISAITAALSLKGHSSKSHSHPNIASMALNTPPVSDDRSSTHSTTSSVRVPKVTPYQADQPPVRLESSVSLVLPNLNERTGTVHGESASVFATVIEATQLVDSPMELPALAAPKELGEAVQYKGPSKARDLATQQILKDSHQGQVGPSPDNKESKDEDKEQRELDLDDEDEDSSDDEDDDAHKVYTTQKPKKNGSKKKEIRIEFSDKKHFMAIPLRSNWMWHHFPQQYDSRIERALAWAKAHKEKEDKRQRKREKQEQREQQRHAAQTQSSRSGLEEEHDAQGSEHEDSQQASPSQPSDYFSVSK